MRLVPFLVAFVVLAATAGSAGATPASPARAGNLSQMKASFTRIKAAEKIVLANASGSIKGHLQNVFAFDDMIYAKLKAANWNILVFAKNAQSLEAQVLKLKPDLAAIKAYFAKCK